jgi:hypothetical protein
VLNAVYQREPFQFAPPASCINVAYEKSHNRSGLTLHVGHWNVCLLHTRPGGLESLSLLIGVWVKGGAGVEKSWKIKRIEGLDSQFRAPHPSKTRNLVRSRAPHPEEKYSCGANILVYWKIHTTDVGGVKMVLCCVVAVNNRRNVCDRSKWCTDFTGFIKV